MKKFSLMLLVLLFIAGPRHAFAETNFDYFFGSKTNVQEVSVARVISTQAFVTQEGETVRMIGIKNDYVPKRKKTGRDKYGFTVYEEQDPLDTMEDRALKFTRSLLEGKRVRLEFDEQRTDDDHNRLAYVFLKETNLFVNAEILRQGFAQLSIRFPNLKYADNLRAAYREAREEKRGFQSR